MARYRGSRIKVIRRLGILPGLTSKSTKRFINDGSSVRQLSQYGFHLQEKQKIRYNYGVSEHELVQYVKKAKNKKGNTGDKLLELLETRLDTILYRSGIVPTIINARQLISHGHVFVNNKKVTVPGLKCNLLDKISLNKNFITSNNIADNSISNHLVVDTTNDKVLITVNNFPDTKILGFSLNILLVLEYYSGK